MLSQSSTSSHFCLGFGRPPRKGTVLLAIWQMKTRNREEVEMPFCLAGCLILSVLQELLMCFGHTAAREEGEKLVSF